MHSTPVLTVMAHDVRGANLTFVHNGIRVVKIPTTGITECRERRAGFGVGHYVSQVKSVVAFTIIPTCVTNV
jgi:Uma2 family endonuclease